MPNLTDTLLRLQSPVGEYLSQYGASKERLAVEEQRKAQIAMQKLDYDLRTQMENRRQAAAEKEATLAKQANSLKANQAYLPKIYEAAYQGITDPNAFMSIWAGTAQMFGLDPITDKPLVSPEEIAMTVKKAQGDRVLAEAEAAKKAIPKKPEYIHHEDKGQVIWEKYDPATGEVTPAGTSPKFKATGGGGGGEGAHGANPRTGRPDFNKFSQAQKQDYLGLYQQFYMRAKNHPELYGQLPPPTMAGVMQFYNSDSDQAGFLDVAPAYMSAQTKIEQATRRAMKNPPDFALDEAGNFNRNLFVRGFLEGKGDEGLSREEAYAMARFNEFRRSLPVPPIPGQTPQSLAPPPSETAQATATNQQIGSGTHNGKHGVYWKTPDGKVIFEPDEE